MLVKAAEPGSLGNRITVTVDRSDDTSVDVTVAITDVYEGLTLGDLASVLGTSAAPGNGLIVVTQSPSPPADDSTESPPTADDDNANPPDDDPNNADATPTDDGTNNANAPSDNANATPTDNGTIVADSTGENGEVIPSDDGTNNADPPDGDAAGPPVLVAGEVAIADPGPPPVWKIGGYSLSLRRSTDDNLSKLFIGDVDGTDAGGRFTLTAIWEKKVSGVTGATMPDLAAAFSYAIQLDAPQGGFKLPQPGVVSLSGGSDPIQPQPASSTIYAAS